MRLKMKSFYMICVTLMLCFVLLNALSEAFPSISDEESMPDRGDIDSIDMDALAALLQKSPKTKRGFCPSKFSFNPVVGRCIPSLRALRGRSFRAGRSSGPN